MNKPSDYVNIKLHCRSMGSFDYYIHDQQEDAAAENAPLDSTHKDHDSNKWVNTGVIDDNADNIPRHG